MDIKAGDKVKVLLPQFKAMWEDRNVWVVDKVRENIGGFKLLYSCHNNYDSSKNTYQFKAGDVEKI